MDAVRLDTLKVMEAYMATFRDVPESYWAYDEIEWMADEGITKGCNPPENDLYCPDEFVTRAQMAVFLYRYDKSRSV